MNIRVDAPRLPALSARWLPGLAISAGLAAIAIVIARIPLLADAAVSPLVIAIVLGMAIGNTFARQIDSVPLEGFDLARGQILRLAIIFYGFRITFGEMQAVGPGALIASVVMVVSTLSVAWFAGRRWFGLDRETALLIGAGSSICGAAAVLATEGVIQSRSAKVGMAVATVVVFGTTSMLVYPFLVPALVNGLGLDWSSVAQGVYTGSTIHEVAQVLVAGSAIGPEVASAALVTKMMRVCLLAPFLLFLSFAWRGNEGVDGGGSGSGRGSRIRIPWFAVIFLALIAIHPWLGLSGASLDHIAFGDDLLLATAMAALGFTVRASAIRAAGLRPLLLGALLFGFLVTAGLGVNLLVAGF